MHLPELPFALGDLPKATIIACGTSYNAGLVAKYGFERIARLPVEVDIASEFRYRARHTAVVKGTDVDQPRNLAKSVTVE